MALRWCSESATNQLIEMDPAEVWDCVVPPDTPLLIDALHHRIGEEEVPGALLFCTLDSQGAPEDLPADSIFVRVRGARHLAQEGFNDAGGILLPKEDDGTFVSFAVCIRNVVHIAASSDTRDSFLAKAAGAVVFLSI